MYRIKFIREEKEILVEPGTRILEAERKAKLVPDAPCGGRGKCGKCRVKIEDHMVLACQTEIHSDLEVDTLSGCQEEEILTEGMQRPVAFRPDLKQKKVILRAIFYRYCPPISSVSTSLTAKKLAISCSTAAKTPTLRMRF